ncbi:MAG TPA: hypothetical protein DCQ37_18145 [Desulfobacteraceae bacterium]|nr:hypothetical protein [Desulfobacteraceae bacterium]
MRFLVHIVVIVSVLFGCLLQSAIAEDLQSEYRELVRKRQKSERQRRSYEKQISALSSQGNTLSSTIFECMAKTTETEWHKIKREEIRLTANKLDAQQAHIAKLRTQLDKKRIDIEQTRIGIEKKYANKDPGSEYEEEFRRYMEDLNDEFLMPVETKLLESYEQYLSGFESYILLLKEIAGQCKGGKTE